MPAVGRAHGSPNFLIVPGLNDSGSRHWQSLWLRLLRNASRAELGDWGQPDRQTWVSALDEAIRTLEPPVILCAHSLGCHAVAWWAALRARSDGWPVAGALLIAPPDCERTEALPTVTGFSPVSITKLPFPAILVGSRDDHHATLGEQRALARAWGASFVDAGALGHINADSEIGHWPGGLALLGRLLSLTGFGRRARPAAARALAA